MYLLGRKDKWTREFGERITPERRKVQIARTTTIEPYLRDYEFFSLAPLYVYAGVRFSIPDQFELEAGTKKRLVVDYQKTVLDNLGRWGQFVEGIEKDAWEPFCRYLTTLLFMSAQKRLVVQIRSKELCVEGTQQKIVTPGSAPVYVRVFMPDSNKARMTVKPGHPATLHWINPHPKIVEMADAILTCHGRIEDAH